jgi:putative oxidoreductase
MKMGRPRIRWRYSFLAPSSHRTLPRFSRGAVFAGLLLLFGRFVPLALTLLAAELYNILAFHLTMSPGTIAPVLVACVL